MCVCIYVYVCVCACFVVLCEWVSHLVLVGIETLNLDGVGCVCIDTFGENRSAMKMLMGTAIVNGEWMFGEEVSVLEENGGNGRPQASLYGFTKNSQSPIASHCFFAFMLHLFYLHANILQNHSCEWKATRRSMGGR